MSQDASNLDSERGSSRDGLHVRAIKVNFPNGRPSGPLELAVSLNDKNYKIKIKEGDKVQWSRNIYCSLPSTVRVCIRRHQQTAWTDFASVETPLSLELPLLSDRTQCMDVTFTISESTASLRAEAAQEQLRVENKEAITEQLERIWSAVELVRSVEIQISSDTHSAVEPATHTTALRSLIEACEYQGVCRDEALDLVKQFEPILSVNSHTEEVKQRVETRRIVQAMLELIEHASEYILGHTSSRVIGNLFSEEYQTKLSGIKSKFARAKQAFDHSVKSEAVNALAGIDMNMQFQTLHEVLKECEDAQFRSEKDSCCLEGTRVDLLERIMNWVVEDTNAQPSVFWLRGIAGSGKSAVANTVAQAVQKRGYLLSSFFCKRDGTNLSVPRRVLPTLAYRFAQLHESYRASIFPFVHADPRRPYIAVTSIAGQFNILFEKTLKQTVDPLRPHVIIIDALNECGSPQEQKDLARYIRALSSLAPWIKVFITSRDEPAIREALDESVCIQCNINEEKNTNDDIRQYAVAQAKSLKFKLSNTDADQLVDRADGLFVWCSTLFAFLHYSHNPRKDLSPFLRRKKRKDARSALYQLYDKVLESVVQTKPEMLFMQAIVAVVAIAACNRPLSARAIALFLRDHPWYRQCREKQVEEVVAKLHTVLYVDRSARDGIRAHHASFYDFLRDKAMDSGSNWEGLAIIHGRMFRTCLTTLHIQLRFNVCVIEEPILNKDIPDLLERVSKNISEELQYSSRFWLTHLLPSNLAESTAANGVSALLCSRKFLFWLESLSLQDSLAQSLFVFPVCASFFKGSPDIVTTAADAQRFVVCFYEAMNSVPHIYLSSLFWLPQGSSIYRDLKLSTLKHLQLIKGKPVTWAPYLSFATLGLGLCCVAHSPDGQYVACSAENNSIYISRAWHVLSMGEPIESLQGHSSRVSCLAYSPNGQLLASGSSDCTVRIWDIKSRRPVFEPLTGHSRAVNCIAWSSVGQFVASGSDDETIRIWNTQTGSLEGEPLRGHRGGIHAVACSPDGVQIASGGDDGTILVWNTSTFQVIRTFRGHSAAARSIKYSPDGCTVVSGSDDHTVRIWDMRIGEAKGQPVGRRTPNGRAILSASDDRTIQLWDAASGVSLAFDVLWGGAIRSTLFSPDGSCIAFIPDDVASRNLDKPIGSETGDQLESHHIAAVHTVTFSPDGYRIAVGLTSGSICVWDTVTGACVWEVPQGHEHRVNSLVHSPDGQFIASGSADRTIRIWNARTGEAIGEPFQGHSDSVQSVAYSPAGNLIASASSDCTVRLWNTQTGGAIGEPLRVGGNSAFSVAFSLDGRSLACGAGNTVFVWRVSSTALTASVDMTLNLRGHSSSVYSVAFSPNGQYIASGSHDCTVRIWDAHTGEPSGSPLRGHTNWVGYVAFSPDSRLIASSSGDRTVRLWDVQTGQAVGDPLREHSGWVRSVAFSPDGHSLASTGDDGRTYVYTVPGTRPSQTFSEAETRWLECCSRMDEQDGWIKDGNTLLLWTSTPVPFGLAFYARLVISGSTTRMMACSVDHEVLFRYSGAAWVNVLSDIPSN